MKSKHFLPACLLTILVLIPYFIIAQGIENVHKAQEGKTIVITYDLTGLNAGQKATVSLFCSEDGGTTWGAALQKVSGDVGTDITVGLGKKNVWDVLSERERFVGDSVTFEVRATLALHRQPFEPEMVFINGGTFQMDSNDGQSNEKPVHKVTVSDFYIGKYEVTQAQWQAVMGSNPGYFKSDNLPVENVSWDDVQQFIRKLNERTGKKYRLPTEAEWEYTCRAGTSTPFNTGSCLSTSQANYDGNYPYSGCNKGEYRDMTTPVGSYALNTWGLYDMHGNVCEWCSDWYGSDYYSQSSQYNSQGPAEGVGRVIRGGSWHYDAQCCQSAHRNYGTPGIRNNYVGFRLVSPR